jgi:hypothetical protein
MPTQKEENQPYNKMFSKIILQNYFAKQLSSQPNNKKQLRKTITQNNYVKQYVFNVQNSPGTDDLIIPPE